MSTEYEAWVASTLGAEDGAPDYDEPSVEELIALMDEIPLMGKECVQDLEVLVTPLSL